MRSVAGNKVLLAISECFDMIAVLAEPTCKNVQLELFVIADREKGNQKST